eukprot:4926645-Pyramimonas_sp.AAC.1
MPALPVSDWSVAKIYPRFLNPIGPSWRQRRRLEAMCAARGEDIWRNAEYNALVDCWYTMLGADPGLAGDACRFYLLQASPASNLKTLKPLLPAAGEPSLKP